ncbi:MAG: sugar phosphate isomerase/epimerase, partial [Candidatus Methanomethylophilaceae archaeon]|nr:sugar phosphate isomerase/epimerase [Candidatus Methanomethylophilaceae archaeon]
MKHLISYSVYQDLNDLSPDLPATLREIKCDGLEILTSHTPVDPVFKHFTVSVHLPYSTDWIAAWDG